jgi:membrane fusion protein (multidrug efflux system)
MSSRVLEPAFSVLEREEAFEPGVRIRRLSRKHLGLGAAALLATLGVAWYGYHWWTVGRFIESTDDAYVGGDITNIAPKVPGFIVNVAVTPGCRRAI